MSLTLILIIFMGIALMILERIFPDQKLEPVPGWWMRVVIINVLQLGIVILGGYTWNTWFAEFSVLSTDKFLSLPLQAICGYIVITFVYYWWHRIHHERGKHYSNFSDLPVWDMLFGTYQNPSTVNAPCGFVTERELRLTDMLLCKNVNKPPRDHAPR